MYLDLGNEVAIDIRDIVAILEERAAETSEVLMELVDRVTGEDRFIELPGNKKSLVVVNQAGAIWIYTSVFTSKSLVKRLIGS